jgi:hypothetical protein
VIDQLQNAASFHPGEHKPIAKSPHLRKTALEGINATYSNSQSGVADITLIPSSPR